MQDAINPLSVTTPLDRGPHPWQLGFQKAATPVMEKIQAFHDYMLWIELGIACFVIGLLGYVIFRYRASRNPVPSKTSHHVLLETIWTLIPVVILAIIAVPSFRLLYFMDQTPPAALTIKAIGNQWYWSYEYPDHQIKFDSQIVMDEKLKDGDSRLLTVDHPIFVPVGTTIRLITTSNDVIHSWAVPAFGIKKDSIPGRLNENWFRVQREGVYYGQCSELCGAKHGFMPIVVKVVSQAQFNHWLAMQKSPQSDSTQQGAQHE